MHLILTSLPGLEARYGRPGRERIVRRIVELIAARQRRGLRSAMLDVEAGDADVIREQVMGAAEGLAAGAEQVESLLIVGGPDLIPFHLLANPMIDSDGPVPSDYPYGAINVAEPLLDWPVGRLPAGRGESPADLLRLLLLATRLQRRPGRADPAFGYAAAAWQRASAEVYAALDSPRPLLLAPPQRGDGLGPAGLDGARRIYCNLHGISAGPAWYGQTDDYRAQLTVALRPADLEGLDLLGALVVSEACYGAYSPAYDLGESIAMGCFRRGAACFVGATSLAYGPAGPPLLGADLLVSHLLRASLEPAISAGEAFQQARRGMMAETLRMQGFLDDDDAKTLAQFVLYGDPTIIVGP